MAGFFDRINASFQQTRVAKYFQLEERGSNLTTEFNGAIATFMTMGACVVAFVRRQHQRGVHSLFHPRSPLPFQPTFLR